MEWKQASKRLPRCFCVPIQASRLLSIGGDEAQDPREPKGAQVPYFLFFSFILKFYPIGCRWLCGFLCPMGPQMHTCVYTQACVHTEAGSVQEGHSCGLTNPPQGAYSWHLGSGAEDSGQSLRWSQERVSSRREELPDMRVNRRSAGPSSAHPSL